MLLNFGVPVEFRLRPWVLTTLGCDFKKLKFKGYSLDCIHTIAISDNVIDCHQISLDIHQFIG